MGDLFAATQQKRNDSVRMGTVTRTDSIQKGTPLAFLGALDSYESLVWWEGEQYEHVGTKLLSTWM